jgi:hypothetical protein
MIVIEKIRLRVRRYGDREILVVVQKILENT